MARKGTRISRIVTNQLAATGVQVLPVVAVPSYTTLSPALAECSHRAAETDSEPARPARHHSHMVV